MLVEILNELWTKRWVRVLSVLIILLLLVWIAFGIFNRKSYKDYGPVSTPFSKIRNFSQLQGGAIYSFNGAAFYKYDIGSKQTTVLQDASRFPLPKQIAWAEDKGVLITFAGPLLDTEVGDALVARGEAINKKTQLYTWYFSFASGELSFVSKYPLRDSAVVYSSGSGGFYYAPDVDTYLASLPEADDQSGVNQFSLDFYNPATNTNKVLVDKIEAVEISEVFNCPGQSACINIVPPINTRNTTLLSVNQNGEQQTLVKSYDGRIFSTNNPELLIRVPNVSDKNGDETNLEGAADSGKALLYNLTSKKEDKLGFEVGDSTLLTNFEGQNFYVFDTNQFQQPEQSEHYYRAGVLSKKGKPSTKAVLITKDDESNSETGVFLPIVSYGNQGRSLFAPVSGNLVLFGEPANTAVIESVDQQAAEKQLKTCQNSGNPEIEYLAADKLFRVFVPQTGDWKGEIARVSKCFGDKATGAMLGYNFQFMLTDPVSGRIVSG